MTLKQKIAIKEVIVILDKLDLLYKIPKSVLENLERNKEDRWEFVYNNNLKLEEQNITRETSILLSVLYLMYICEDDKEKQKLKSIYMENEKKIQYKNEFEYYIKNINNENIVESNSLIPIDTTEKNISIIDRIENWFKLIFKK